MGYRNLQIKLPTDYSNDEIRQLIQKQLGVKDVAFEIEKKSLDARKKDNIHWLVSLIVSSGQLKGEAYIPPETLHIQYKKRKERVIVVGSGPAGFFAAHVLQMAGYKVTIIERGSEVTQRTEAIQQLESKGRVYSTK